MYGRLLAAWMPNLTSAPGTHIKDIVVYLLPAVDYLGKVIDPDEAPVEGARIKLFIRADRQPALMPLPDQFVSDKQGEFRFHAPDFTLVEAISAAGGVASDSYLSGAYVVRDREILLVNFYKLIEKRNMGENIPLAPNDVIYIPDNKEQRIFVLGEANKQSAYPNSSECRNGKRC